MTEQCACGGKPMPAFPCSGAADIGEMADRAARGLSNGIRVKLSRSAGCGIEKGKTDTTE
jgi:uncharacterized metal-binding protein